MQRANFEALTWLRAFAAMVVVVSHAILAVGARDYPATLGWIGLPIRYFDLGDFGVYLFFALSGCTLYVSNSELASTQSVGYFYGKRFMRIWPAFIAAVLAFQVFDLCFAALNPEPGSRLASCLNAGGWSEGIRYAALLFNITGPQGYFNAVFWSIPVEFQFYLMFPLVLMLMKVRGFSVLAPCCAGVALYLLGRFELLPLGRQEVLTMAWVFFGGMLVGHWRLRDGRRMALWPGLSLLLLVISVVAAKRAGWLGGSDFGAKFYGGSALVCVVIAMSIDTRDAMGHWLARVTSRYGEVSYSIYLFHMLFVASAWLCATYVGMTGAGLLYTVAGVALFSSYLFSLYSFRLIEAPSISLGRRWFGARRAGIATPPAPA